MGQRFKATEQQRHEVEAMAGFGMTIPEIAVVIDKAEATIKRHFRKELSTGHLKANAKVAQNLYKIATATDAQGNPLATSAQVSAAQFWMKTRARWTTQENLHITTPQNAEHLADLRNLSSQDLRELERITRQLEAVDDPEEPVANRLEGKSNGLPPLN